MIAPVANCWVGDAALIYPSLVDISRFLLFLIGFSSHFLPAPYGKLVAGANSGNSFPVSTTSFKYAVPEGDRNVEA